MTLDELKTEWERDCVIDELDLGSASAKGPGLHSKFLNELIQVKLKQTKLQLDLAALKALKGRYFRGELTTDELKEKSWEQWQYRSLKSDIPDLIEADKDVQLLLGRDMYLKAIIYFLESVMGEIRSRSFVVKNCLEWQKFRAGG